MYYLYKPYRALLEGSYQIENVVLTLLFSWQFLRYFLFKKITRQNPQLWLKFFASYCKTYNINKKYAYIEYDKIYWKIWLN